ncbi:MAG: hypothetical protein V4488_04405 [Pseudomonadota bacterium]
MKIIATKQNRSDKYDLLRCVRQDGSAATAKMPRQGVLPHDLIHYVVESALLYEHGFLGLIAQGADFAYVMEQTHGLPNKEVAEQAIHAEAIVESLQAQLWAGSFDTQQFLDGLAGACTMRQRSIPNLGTLDLHEDLYQRVVELGQRWQELPYYGSLELEMVHI